MFYKCLIREDVPVVSALFEKHVVLLKAKEKFWSYWHGQSQCFLRMVVKHPCGKEPELILCFKTKGHIIGMVFVFTQIFDAFFSTHAHIVEGQLCV